MPEREIQIDPPCAECPVQHKCCHMDYMHENVIALFSFSEDGYCSNLTPDGECSIYNDRPEVCRTFNCLKASPIAFADVQAWVRGEDIP